MHSTTTRPLTRRLRRIRCLRVRRIVGSIAGEMIVLATGDKFEELARNPIGEGSHTTPCVDGGRLYVRTFNHLVCIAPKS